MQAVTSFPTSLAEAPVFCEPTNPARANAGILALQERGLSVQIGIMPEQVPQLLDAARQEHIAATCPGDQSPDRFETLESTMRWLEAGRALFLLLRQSDFLGYGWMGPKTSEHVPGGQTSLATRMCLAGLQQGLALPFRRAMQAESCDSFGATNVWTQVWASNIPSVRTNLSNGLVEVARVPSPRPTSEGVIEDERIFFSLPNRVLRTL